MTTDLAILEAADRLNVSDRLVPSEEFVACPDAVRATPDLTRVIVANDTAPAAQGFDSEAWLNR